MLLMNLTPLSATLVSRYRLSLLLQLIHRVRCVAWNGMGSWQKAHGQATIGPTSSWGTLGLSAALFALLVVVGGFTRDPALWQSEFRRWAGMAVNSIGVAAFPVALATFLLAESRSN